MGGRTVFGHLSMAMCVSLRGIVGVRLSPYLQKGEATPPRREGAVQPPDCPHAHFHFFIVTQLADVNSPPWLPTLCADFVAKVCDYSSEAAASISRNGSQHQLYEGDAASKH
jgi:hypothetical protein